jgi:hypothetical protein
LTTAGFPPDDEWTGARDLTIDEIDALERAREAAHDTRVSCALRDRLLTVGLLRSLPSPQPLIKGLLDLDSFALIYGQRGTYKSFLANGWGLSVATGSRWEGRPVTYGPVIYVLGEGVSGQSQRIDAWLSQHPGEPDPDDFYVLPEPVNLLDPARVGAFADMAVDIGPRLILFDTLARCMVGGDENSAKDAGIAVEQLDIIRRRTGACVAAVHHAGKNASAGARGSSAFEAAADTVLEVTAEDASVTVTPTKQKHHPVGNPYRLTAVPTKDRIALTSWRPDAAGDLSGNALIALDALASASAGLTGGVSATVWLMASGLPERTFYRVKGDLTAKEYVAVKGTEHQPRFSLIDRSTATFTEGGVADDQP